MAIRVIDRQPFGGSGVVEGPVGGDEGHRSQASLSLETVNVEGNRQLHGVVGPEPVPAGGQHGIGEQGGSELDDAVALGQMAAEMAEDCGGLGGGAIARPPAARDAGKRR
jgi:hypothetical protein